MFLGVPLHSFGTSRQYILSIDVPMDLSSTRTTDVPLMTSFDNEKQQQDYIDDSDDRTDEPTGSSLNSMPRILYLDVKDTPAKLRTNLMIDLLSSFSSLYLENIDIDSQKILTDTQMNANEQTYTERQRRHANIDGVFQQRRKRALPLHRTDPVSELQLMSITSCLCSLVTMIFMASLTSSYIHRGNSIMMNLVVPDMISSRREHSF
jgi:hypothetical protein